MIFAYFLQLIDTAHPLASITSALPKSTMRLADHLRALRRQLHASTVAAHLAALSARTVLGGVKRFQRRHASGNLTVGRRVCAFLDASFRQAQELAGYARSPGAAVVTEHGSIACRPVQLCRQDFTVTRNSLPANRENPGQHWTPHSRCARQLSPPMSLTAEASSKASQRSPDRWIILLSFALSRVMA